MSSKQDKSYLPLSRFSFYQNFDSCRYLLPLEDTSILNFNPYLISTLFKKSLYLMYRLYISATNSSSSSLHSYSLKVGIFLPSSLQMNCRALWTRFPRLASSSLLFLSMKSFHENQLSLFSGRFTRRQQRHTSAGMSFQSSIAWVPNTPVPFLFENLPLSQFKYSVVEIW